MSWHFKYMSNSCTNYGCHRRRFYARIKRALPIILDVQQFGFGKNWIEGCTSMNYNKLKPTVSWERKEMPWTMSSSMCEDSTMSCVRMRMACGSVYN